MKIVLPLLLLTASAISAAPMVQYDGTYQEVHFTGTQRTAQDRKIQVVVDRGPRHPWSATLRISDGHGKVLRTDPVSSAYLTTKTAVYLDGSTPPLVLVVEGPFPAPARQAGSLPLTGHILQPDTAGPFTVQGTWHTQPILVRPGSRMP
ncbi:MAG TPA: hypothetical protein VGO93_00035 [Candidatus Xenobia bacterium]|jgi:hypothetical protein